MDIEILKKTFRGELMSNAETEGRYSEDMSIFRIVPELIAFPKDAEDVKVLVRFARDAKRLDPNVSLTARAAGTDMTGGPLNESVIVSFTEHMNIVKEISERYAVVEPGLYFRDLEPLLDEKGVMYPPYPASKDLCALGGMVANNSGGEKTLRYGKTEDYVEEVKLILGDGEEHTFSPLEGILLQRKLEEDGYEGNIYRKMYALLETHYDVIKAAKPDVSKNSAGYYLWNVWDRKTGIFDLTKLIVGSQGTLGLLTEATLRLIPKKKYSRLAVIFVKSLEPIPELVKSLLPLGPESIESYDDRTLSLALKFFPSLLKLMKGSLFTLALRFFPEFLMVFRGGFPKMVILVEMTSDDEAELVRRMEDIKEKMEIFPVQVRLIHTDAEAEKYWTIRRQSFALIHSHAKNKYAAAFVDDIIVKPEYMPEFLPEVNAVLDKYKSELIYTIAGHPGNGNFHIIPLMDLSDPKVRASIPKISDEIYDIVAKYKGSITAEHNDGLVRTPYLGKMYSKEILGLFAEVKEIFDPEGIFNPGKKTHANLKYAMHHMRES
ncbi:MAG: Oxidoreductase [Candidatus Jorgensenbacteria bacterium GW2011_GWA2_45_13]|uniref:Oxidoreductase n=1 Tax=Candidatus Jorgensenbacteria bacterium GW2011_GWA2_45_13 TaxID=1618662 RepID=A0A0G1L8M3_9BACT|nr:MAG: Oxidoreductase [Candidatus Jorgensenbacteria bacterium GW2011_GWA2_45_13]